MKGDRSGVAGDFLGTPWYPCAGSPWYPGADSL